MSKLVRETTIEEGLPTATSKYVAEANRQAAAPIKVTKEEILEASKEMLHKQVYVVFSTPTEGIGPVMENLATHLEHQRSLERAGVMLAAGPHWTDDERFWDGEGMFVIRAKSLEEAREIAAADPMHKCGARSFRVRPWLINEGMVNLHFTFSNGRMTIE
jgi:uncharacterized protein